MSDSKKSAWDGYRRRAKCKWLIPLLFLCIVIFPQAGPIFFLLMVVCVIVSIPSDFTCPRCNNLFFSKFIIGPFGYSNMFAEQCLNCGLRKWEEPPPKPQSREIESKPVDENSIWDPVMAERLRPVKFLTLFLRDDPKAIGLRLDANGWADIDDLLKRANCNGIKLTRENLGDVLPVSENHRFERDQPGCRIRRVKS